MSTMPRVSILSLLLISLGCVGLQKPRAFESWKDDQPLPAFVDEQAGYCTELHDQLNDTFWLDVGFYTSAVFGGVSVVASGISLGAAADHLFLGQNFTGGDVDVAYTLGLIQASAVVVGGFSGVVLAYTGDRRADIDRAKAQLLEVRAAALSSKEQEVLEDVADPRAELQALTRIGGSCYEVALQLAQDGEAKTLGFVRALSEEVVAQANAAVERKDAEKVEVARAVSDGADAQLLETLKRVQEDPDALKGLLKRAERSLAAQAGLVKPDDACLLGVRVVDETELVFPPGAIVDFSLEAEQAVQSASVYNLIGVGDDLVDVELAVGAGSKQPSSTTFGPVEVPARLVLGDGAVTVRGKTQKPRLGWPVDLDPGQTTSVKLKVGRMASVNVSWRCRQKKKDLTATLLEKGADMAKEKLDVR